MQTTAKKTHLRLAYTKACAPARDPLREMAAAYSEAFRETLNAFLAFENVEAVRIESALVFVDGQPCLRILVHEPGRDPFVNTRIFAAANAATTYLGLRWDNVVLRGALTFADVRVEIAFAEAERSAFGSPASRLRAI